MSTLRFHTALTAILLLATLSTVRADDKAVAELNRLLGNHRVHATSYCPATQTLAYIDGTDGSIRIAREKEPKVEFLLEGHAGPIDGSAMDAEGRWLATGSADQTIRLWDLTTKKLLRKLDAHKGAVLAVAFRPDGKQLASAGVDKTVRLCDPATGETTQLLKTTTVPVVSLAFGPDGKSLAVGWGESVEVWNASTGKETLTIKAHSPAVWSLDFSPKGDKLASVGSDRTVRVWDVATGKEIRAFPKNEDHYRVAFLQDDMVQADSASVCVLCSLKPAKP